MPSGEPIVRNSRTSASSRLSARSTSYAIIEPWLWATTMNGPPPAEMRRRSVSSMRARRSASNRKSRTSCRNSRVMSRVTIARTGLNGSTFARLSPAFGGAVAASILASIASRRRWSAGRSAASSRDDLIDAPPMSGHSGSGGRSRSPSAQVPSSGLG